MSSNSAHGRGARRLHRGQQTADGSTHGQVVVDQFLFHRSIVLGAAAYICVYNFASRLAIPCFRSAHSYHSNACILPLFVSWSNRCGQPHLEHHVVFALAADCLPDSFQPVYSFSRQIGNSSAYIADIATVISFLLGRCRLRSAEPNQYELYI